LLYPAELQAQLRGTVTYDRNIFNCFMLHHITSIAVPPHYNYHIPIVIWYAHKIVKIIIFQDSNHEPLYN